MNYRSSSVLVGAASKLAAVLDVVRMLGYRRVPAEAPAVFHIFDEKDLIGRYYWFDEEDYRSYTGVVLAVRKLGKRDVEVHTFISGARSYWDYEQQVRTIRTLRRHFGGRFTTRNGTNRFWTKRPSRVLPTQAGCHQAFERLGVNIIRAQTYLAGRVFPGRQWRELSGFEEIDTLNPRTLSNHLLLPFLVAAVEDYLKSTFVALLRYSPRKDTVLRAARLSSERLRAVVEGTQTVEEAVAASLPFQNILAGCEHFKALEPKLDLAGELRRPYRRRKERLLDSLQRLVERRHAFIHRAESDLSFDDEDVARAVDVVDVALTRCQERIYTFHGWRMDRIWHASAAVSTLREAKARSQSVQPRRTGKSPRARH